MDTITMKKYHGLGNDYLVLDPNKNELKLQERNIKLLCQRNFGVGADGILYGPILEDNQIKVQIFNPDGSEAEKSGNGVRIFAKYLLDEGYVKDKEFVLNTIGGYVNIQFLDDNGDYMRVNMGKASFASDDIPVSGFDNEVINEPMTFHNKLYNTTCLSVGNPHCVIMLEEVNKEKAAELGPYVESADYFPKRINMQLLKIIDRQNIQIEIYERGAGYTLASGSSSCAAAATAFKMGLTDSKVTVHMPGGNLEIEVMPDYSIFMTGSVTYIGSFTLAENFFA